jgi:protease I
MGCTGTSTINEENNHEISFQKNILMIVGDYSEDYEVMVPFQLLSMVGHNVHAVCPNKKSGEKIATAIHDFIDGSQTYIELKGHHFQLNKTFDEVNLKDYHGLVLPGGRGAEYLRLDKKVLDYVEYFFKNNLPVAAVCHGVQILTPIESIKGRNMTGYPACQTEVKLSGSTYQEVAVDDCYVDGNLVTAVAWPGHPKWLAAFLKLLGTGITSR